MTKQMIFSQQQKQRKWRRCPKQNRSLGEVSFVGPTENKVVEMPTINQCQTMPQQLLLMAMFPLSRATNLWNIWLRHNYLKVWWQARWKLFCYFLICKWLCLTVSIPICDVIEQTQASREDCRDCPQEVTNCLRSMQGNCNGGQGAEKRYI